MGRKVEKKRVNTGKTEGPDPLRRRGEVCCSLLAAALTGILVVAVFALSGRFPGQKHIFLYGDYYVQYMQFIRLFLRDLTEGRSLFYSFEVSMGMPVWALFAYESLSPLNLWFLLVSDADTAAFLVVLSKLMLCGAAFCFFSAHTLNTPRRIAVALGCIYAFCGYNMSFYFNVQYLDGVYLLPLLMLLLVRFVKSGRIRALAAAFTFSFVVLFYSGYMLGIFCSVVCAGLLYLQYGSDKALFLRRLGSYLFCMCCAVLLSAPVTVPVAAFLLRNTPQDATVLQGFRTDITGFLAGFLPGRTQGLTGMAPAVYSGILTIPAVIAFFADKKQPAARKRFALLPLGFLLVCTFFSPAYLMMHGFDAPDMNHFRFAYMYSFVLLSIAAEEIRCFCAERRPAVAVGKKRELLFAAVVLTELLIHGYLSLTPDTDDLIRSADYYRRWQREGSMALEQICRMEEADLKGSDTDGDAFYRVYYENAPGNNHAAWLDYHGVGYFSSLEQPALRDALYRLGYCASPRQVSDYGSTPFTRMIFAQKYMVHGTHPLYEREDEFVAAPNPCSLSLAFMVPDRMREYALSGEDVFAAQNGLARAMTGLDLDIYETYGGEVRMQENGLHSEKTSEGYRLTSDTGKGGSFSVLLDPEPGRLLFAYFSQDTSSRRFHTAKIGTNMDIGLPTEPSYLSAPHILPVYEDGEIRILTEEEDAQTAVFREMHFAYLQEEAFFRVYAELAAGNVKNMDFREDRISFDAGAYGDKTLLFTTIPYDPGWKVKVDGAPAETLSTINHAFLAVPLTPGEHHIELRYRDASFFAGILMSIAGAILLLAVRRRP